MKTKGWSEMLPPLYVAIAFVLVFGVMSFLLYHRFSVDAGPLRAEYEGRVVDKWASFAETYTGSETYYRLLIEDKDGRQFKVVADDDLYNRAKVGMWIKHTKDGTKLAP